MRAPFQVIVLPYRILPDGSIRYAILRRDKGTGGYWQGIAGGGEANEDPMDAAKRESCEEAGIDQRRYFIQLDSMCTIPVVHFGDFLWGPNVLVIPEYAFGVRVEDIVLRISDNHTQFKWVIYTEALKLLHWDSNKTALWELNHRLIAGDLNGS